MNYLQKNTIVSFVAAAALHLLVPAAMAQTPLPQENELGSVEQEITSSAANLEKIRGDIAAAIKDQEQVSDRLIAIAKTIQSQETAITAAEERILNLRKEEIILRADLAEKQEVLSELLAGLQRLEQNPPPALVVEPHDVLAALRGAMMFGTLVPELRGEAEILAKKLTRLDRIRTAVEKEKSVLGASVTNLKTAQIDLDQLIAQKKQLVFDNAGKLAGEKRRAAELADRAKSLKQLIADLAAARLKQEARRPGRPSPSKRNASARRNSSSGPPWHFPSTKGRLEYPVQGQILKRFGQDDGLGSELRGLAVATRAQAQVIAPADGKVEFAGPFRSYGQLLILECRGGLPCSHGWHEGNISRYRAIRQGWGTRGNNGKRPFFRHFVG